MKKIPSNVPVFIQDLESQENGRYSTAKLKVFYQGETADHRLFTKKFSERLIETLPSTPVVGYYSDEDEDFLGHNTTQYVYGHVPETATIEFVEDEESGNLFAVTDVILYTERKDNIGSVARKIVGKQHSLELDSDTLQYKINRDNSGKFLNIEFIDGQFIGLSVLGDNETPAFTGSGFFTTNQDFKEFAAQCHNNFDRFLSFLDKSGGEIQVFNSEEFFGKAGEFLAKTMQEYQADIYAALEAMGIYGFIEENTNEYVVVFMYNQDTDCCGHYKYTIETNEAGQMSLVNPTPVRARFLTDEQINSLDFALQNHKDEKEVDPDKVDDEDDKKPEFEADKDDVDKDDESDKDNTDKDDEEDEDDDKKLPFKSNEEEEETPSSDTDEEEKDPKVNEAKKDEEDEKSKCASDPKEENDKEGETDGTDPQKDDEKEKETNKVGTATASSSATTLSDAERTELEQYRKSEKLAIIAEYAAELDATILDVYRADVDKYSKTELEAQLALEYRKFMLTKKETISVKNVSTYSRIISNASDYDENNPADAINKYKK